MMIEYADPTGKLYTNVSPDTPLPVSASVDSAGRAFSPDNLPQTLTYNADGTVATISVTNGTTTWTQTFTYTSGNLTGISAWVAQ